MRFHGRHSGRSNGCASRNLRAVHRTKISDADTNRHSHSAKRSRPTHFHDWRPRRTMTQMSVDAKLAKVEDTLGKVAKHLGITDKQTTRALAIIDKSGSMGQRVKATIDGYNEWIGSLKQDDSD